jgi:hypothetical protein
MSLYRAGEFYIGIRKENDVYYLQYVNPNDPTPSFLDDTLVRSKNGNQVRFTNKENGEYYIVTKSGDLSIYDNYGLIETYTKAKAE